MNMYWPVSQPLLLLFLPLPPGPQAVQQLWGFMVDKLLEAINLEPDSEIVGIMMDSLCKVRILFAIAWPLSS